MIIMQINLIGLKGIPLVKKGDDVAQIIRDAIVGQNYEVKD